ncbi:MAG: fasciclin domain-containing protein [Chloroflexi bacterium]|nr:fasciclin domain-containing protein [Chloroflexota bacterium]
MKKSIAILLVLAIAFASVGNVRAQEETGNTIVDIAVADERFDTLVAALTAAELTETLSGEGPFTVLAPTDDAFAKLPDALLTQLLGAPEAELTQILLFHVIPGEFGSDVVSTLSGAPSVQGQVIDIESRKDGLYAEGAKIIITDIQASNGVIHVIDSVMVPQNTPAEKAPTTVLFNTPFFTTNVPVYANFGSGETPLGTYNTFSWDFPIEVQWAPYTFESPNGAYRLAIRQYDPIFNNYVEIKVAFHWDENPNDEQFTFGALGFVEGVFLNIFPSYVVVEPHTYSTFLDTSTGVTEYQYTPVAGAPTQWSDPFVITRTE